MSKDLVKRSIEPSLFIMSNNTMLDIAKQLKIGGSKQNPKKLSINYKQYLIEQMLNKKNRAKTLKILTIPGFLGLNLSANPSELETKLYNISMTALANLNEGKESENEQLICDFWKTAEEWESIKRKKVKKATTTKVATPDVNFKKVAKKLEKKVKGLENELAALKNKESKLQEENSNIKQQNKK